MSGEGEKCPELFRAHRFSSCQREELEEDTKCGCFYCRTVFFPKEITQWLGDPPETAVCPHCGVDAVIGAYTGYPITPEFLERMHRYWF
jgi:hypothetical protein